MELTDRQLKVLAEFLGKDRGGTREPMAPLHLTFQEWLLSNAGQAALMDKLGAHAINFTFLAPDEDLVFWEALIDKNIKRGAGKLFVHIGKGDTRQEALINVVLDMLKEKNGS